MIFETHAHYDDEKFDEDRAELLSSMQENGIGRIINVSANLESLENTRKLMEAYPFIYGAFGLHPDEVGDLNEDVMARMRELCRMEKAVRPRPPAASRRCRWPPVLRIPPATPAAEWPKPRWTPVP